MSPVYQAEATVDELVSRLTAALSPLTPEFEIVLVNDGSSDRSWEKIQAAAAVNPHVIGVNLSRNFGQHNAIAAGLRYCDGDYVVVMDCDLQDQPESISKLYAKACEGYEVVFASRANRQDGLIKRLSSKLFFRFLGYLSGTKNDGVIGNFGIFHRQVIEAIHSMGDSIRWFPGMVRWVGFRQTSIEVPHAQRVAGRSNYSFRKSLHLALDILLLSSEKPLRLIIKAGLCMSALSFAFASYVIFQTLTGKIGVTGWPSLIVSLWFLAGLIIFVLGFVGLYIGKIYNEVKDRPVYLVADVSASRQTGEKI